MATPRRRRLGDQLLQASGLFVMVIALGALAALLFDVFVDGAGRLSWQFLTSLPSRRASQAGLATALVGSIYVILLTAIIAVPIGIGAAIYLEEYGARGRMARLIEINLANLAGVPSIIYGLLGLACSSAPSGSDGVSSPAPQRLPCSCCLWSSCPRGRRFAPCRTRSARARTRSAPPNGRPSGRRSCRWRCLGS